MEFSRKEYWNGLPGSLAGDLPDPGIGHGSPALQVDSLPSEPQGIQFNNSTASVSKTLVFLSMLNMLISDMLT